MKSAQYTLARQRLMPLIEKEPDRLAYQLALADIELSVGRVDAALAIYEDNQRLYPDDRALTLNEVHALLTTGRPDKAAKLLQTQIELGETGRQIYKLMAQAKGDMGQKK
jgi:predicted Zn-dependent protease